MAILKEKSLLNFKIVIQFCFDLWMISSSFRLKKILRSASWTNLSPVNSFSLSLGFPEYRCFINPEKTLINFTHNQIKVLPKISDDLPWCGLLINTYDLSVMSDYSTIQKQGGMIIEE